MEVGRRLHQRSYRDSLHFGREWMHLCPVKSTLFPCLDPQSAESLCNYFEERRYVSSLQNNGLPTLLIVR